METRKLGRSDVKATVITFGAWAIGGWMWGGADRKEAVEAIKASMDHGVTSIDTAPAYGQGLSEELCGEAIRGTDRTKIQLLTKYGLRWDTTMGEFFFKSRDNQGKVLMIHKLASKESIMKECETESEAPGNGLYRSVPDTLAGWNNTRIGDNGSHAAVDGTGKNQGSRCLQLFAGTYERG